MTTELDRAPLSQADTEPSHINVPYGAVPRETGFKVWAEILEPVFEVKAGSETMAEFRFGFESWALGTAVIGQCMANGHAFERSSRTIARSGIDHVMIQVATRGGLLANFEGRSVQGRPGDVCVFDLSRPVSTTSPDFQNITLIVPRSILAPMVADYDSLHGLVLAAETPRARLLGSHIMELARQLPSMTRDEIVGMAEPTVHLAAGCLGTSLDHAVVVAPVIDHARLGTIKAYIDRHLGAPDLDADSVCRSLGLSRSKLYRLFEASGGVAAHIRRRRLSQCLRELTSRRCRADRISEIAYRWGFTNEASFSRAFRGAFGLSPSEARRAGDLHLRRSQSRESHAGQNGASLASWMFDLMHI